MMFFTFALLSISLILLINAKKYLSIFFMMLCLIFAIKEFLWEIHSPDYGYRMPWIQTEIQDDSSVVSLNLLASTNIIGQKI